MITKENIQDIYGLSPMQKSMLINHAIDPLSSAYTEQFDFQLSGRVNPDQMRRALGRLMDYYAVLRTIFSYRKTEQPRQIVLKTRQPELIVKHFEGASNTAELVDRYKEEDKKRGFDLSRDVLIRGAMLRVGEEKWHLILTFHHIILDGWSLAPLLEKLFELYESPESSDTHISVSEEQPYYKYIQWLENQDDSKAASYWKQYLEGYEKAVKLPSIRDEGEYIHQTHTFELGEELTKNIHDLAKSHQVTTNVVFQTAWGILLQKYNYSTDVVYGNVVSGRPPELVGIDSSVGLFTNTIPIRIQTDESDNFISLCSKVQRTSIQSLSYESYPLYDIQRFSPLKNNLLDHVVAFENYPLAEKLQNFTHEKGSSIKINSVTTFERTNYDFHVTVNPGSNIIVKFTFNKRKYTKEIVEGIHRSLITLLEVACHYPDRLITQLSISSDYDRQLVLEEFNKHDITPMPGQTVDQMFRDVADTYPDKTALRWKKQMFTYEEVDMWSDKIAIKLKGRGIGPNDYVGVFVPRCPEMVVGMLAILKTGASFVPLDLDDSVERIKYIIQDANLQAICTKSDVVSFLPEDLDPILMDQSIETDKMEYIDSNHGTKDSAYLMYTSGTTGQPKGCNIIHENILSLVFNQEYIDFGPHQVILQTGSPAFDACTFEIWGTLLHGGTLVLVEEKDILDPVLLEKQIMKHGVLTMWLTAPLFNQLCNLDPHIFQSLETLLVGGDTLSVPHIQKAIRANPNLKIINGYGPTENTTFSTTHKVTETDFITGRVPIGRPLVNRHVYIVDSGLNLLPIGGIGELCVGGTGVGLGYHNQEKLSEQYFMDDPFQLKGRLYRTGDLARWLPDGSIDFLGRKDTQVKIHGYRVELEEIEHAFGELPGVDDVVIQVKKVGDMNQLCAYYTGGMDPEQGEFRNKLAAKIPQYMIPNYFILLDEIPLNRNGKVDYRVLPDPVRSGFKSKSYTPPTNEIEKKIVQIIASVLESRLEDIGINDNFFEIGLTSLSLIQMNSRLKDALDLEIPIAVLFEHTTVSQLAGYIQSSGNIQMNEVDKDEENEAMRGILAKTNTLIRRMGGDG